MSLTLQEQSLIFRHLKVPRDKHEEVTKLCESIVSEVAIETIRSILQEIVSTNESLQEAAEGLIQADVLKWSEERNCTLRWRYKSLRHDLADFIGYNLPYCLPF